MKAPIEFIAEEIHYHIDNVFNSDLSDVTLESVKLILEHNSGSIAKNACIRFMEHNSVDVSNNNLYISISEIFNDLVDIIEMIARKRDSSIVTYLNDTIEILRQR